MITAIVFVQVDNERIAQVAEQIASLEGVSEVYSVTGRIDLVAIVRVSSFDEISEVISNEIAKVPGVRMTETHMAFRTYSRRDLETAFAIGSGE